ncbi:hypothetical protein MIR68_001101 [Amoeboaphelidium protococcarum]|nr:hypothetical protein MIR68_001101 [Amoeboaphelidium protococcarum]
MTQFQLQNHVKYVQRCIKCLPNPYTSTDSSRLTLIFFALGSLKLICNGNDNTASDQFALNLDGFSTDQTDFSKEDLIRYLGEFKCQNGFMGCTQSWSLHGDQIDQSNLAMTYSALCLVINHRIPISRILNETEILQIMSNIAQCQCPDGSFIPQRPDADSQPFGLRSFMQRGDMRFVYCAVSIAYILNKIAMLDIDLITSFILGAQSYDGGFGQRCGEESHGGSTYCAVASLSLLGRLDPMSEIKRDQLQRWLIKRQIGGFNGRLNKDADTCYTFWICASMQILDDHFDTNLIDCVDKPLAVSFLEDTEFQGFGGIAQGGFGKEQDDFPDLLHTYLGLAGISIMTKGLNNQLRQLDPRLNVNSEDLTYFQAQ